MFGAELLELLDSKGMEGSDCGAGAELWFAPQFDSLPSLSNLKRNALLPREEGKAIIMADFIRHCYLLVGVDVKYNDTELMVGYETMEFETPVL